MDTCAFVSLEDVSDALPAYREDVVSVELAGKLKDAYEQLQDDITATLQEQGETAACRAPCLMRCWFIRIIPTDWHARRFPLQPEIQQREMFVIAETEDLE